MKIKLLLITIFILFVAGCSHSLGNPSSTNYGQRFMYLPVREIEFPDFRLKFVGDREGGSIDGLLLAPIFDFQVVTPTASNLIHWSSGTGDIGPATFKIQSKCYWLELVMSDEFGKLKESEAVVSQRQRPTDCRQDEEAR